MILRPRLAIAIALWVALLAFMLLTRPETLPVGVLILPLLLFGAAMYITMRFILETLRPKPELQTRQRLFAIIVTLGITVCVGLQSIGELSSRDFFTVLLLSGLGYFYVARNTR